MKIARSLAAVLLAATAPVDAQDSGGRLSVSLGGDHSSGRYGGTSSTNVSYVPLTLRYERADLMLKLTLPYVSISGPGTVVGGDRPIVVDSAGNAQRRRVSGFGDVVASAGYTVHSSRAITIDVTAKIKLATASASDGLGTGKNDYSLQSDAFRTFGSLTAFAGLGYRWYGFFGSAGASYKAGDTLSFGAAADYRQAIVAGRDPIVELAPFVSVKLKPDTKLQFYVVRGFTDSSPDWGAGTVLTHSY
jgi:hypothetical protein